MDRERFPDRTDTLALGFIKNSDHLNILIELNILHDEVICEK
jgi:hypothetical protein